MQKLWMATTPPLWQAMLLYQFRVMCSKCWNHTLIYIQWQFRYEA